MEVVDSNSGDGVSRPAGFALERHSVAVELYLTGEFDIAACPRLTREVEQLLGEGCRSLTIDLSAVTFMDAAAIGALVRSDQQMVAQDGVLELVCNGGQPRHILSMTGMTAAFRLRPLPPPPSISAAEPHLIASG